MANARSECSVLVTAARTNLPGASPTGCGSSPHVMKESACRPVDRTVRRFEGMKQDHLHPHDHES